MLTKETCVKIWNCHNEIDKCHELLKGLKESIAKDKERREPTLHNAFGENVGLQLGVPSGPDGHRIFGVNIDLGEKITTGNKIERTACGVIG